MLIVFDIDEVLANTEHRTHFIDKGDWDSFYSAKQIVLDSPIQSGIMLYSLFADPKYRVEIWTGRSKQATLGTKKWIKTYLPYMPAALRMRSREDRHTNADFKRGLIREYGKPFLVFEGIAESCKMWESRGISFLYSGLN